MGRTKELLHDEPPDDDEPVNHELLATLARLRQQAAEEQLAREQEWVRVHPREWAEWLRLGPLLAPSFRGYDFEDFLADVGRPESDALVVVRKNDTLPYQEGNLRWARAKPAPQAPGGDPLYMTCKEVVGLTGLGKSRVYELFEEGELPGYRSGKRRLFKRRGVLAYVERNRNATAPAAKTPRRRPPSRKAAAPTGLKYL